MGEFDKEGFSLDGVPDTATVVFGTGVFDGSDAAHEAETDDRERRRRVDRHSHRPFGVD